MYKQHGNIQKISKAMIKDNNNNQVEVSKFFLNQAESTETKIKTLFVKDKNNITNIN